MDIKSIVERIEKESIDYFISNKAADDWITVPRHLLVQILFDVMIKVDKIKFIDLSDSIIEIDDEKFISLERLKEFLLNEAKNFESDLAQNQMDIESQNKYKSIAQGYKYLKGYLESIE